MGEIPAEPLEEEPGDSVSPRALDLVLRVGELLLASGEATERVNESMLSLAVAYELPRPDVAVTFTVITVNVHPGNGAMPVTGGRAIRRRFPAYWRLVALHALVQEASLGMLDVEEAHRRLAEIKRMPPPYPPWLMVVGLGLIAASANVMVGGGPLGAGTAFVATILGDRTAAALARRGVAEFFQFTVAAGIGAAAASLVIAVGAPAHASAIVTGAVLALLPGRPLVASIQDGITGDLISAGARLLEVFFIVAAIVSGLGVVVYAAVRLGIPVDVGDLPAAPASLLPVTVIAAAAVSLTFALSLAVPRAALAAAALGGALIWVVYVLARGAGVTPVLASAIGAVIVGLLGNLLARRRHEPALPYIVPAIAPLLPGTALYRGMIELNLGLPQDGVLSLIGGISVALALGAGVNLGGEFVRAFQRVGLGVSGRGARPAARRTRGY
ncbi:threonine/serine exporter family protein [Actinoallomurus spadix]|uniref:Threonine/serine exporter family protein n=1 Tax=Actinoallomurus spadix TaxID=79912 RepID=A0ABP3H8E5_9ACTN|nr:threonine/serine exporter family protein [Actinoallomurus spadix]MCO5987623.1 threonine/serine exporter family protein [Actinoallomurus spadix]